MTSSSTLIAFPDSVPAASVAFTADAASIRKAVLAVLADSSSCEGARRMATVIANYGGATTAVSQLERLTDD